MSDKPTGDDRLDDVVLALLWSNGYLDHGVQRGWKTLPWDVLDRLHAKGLIGPARGKAKSMALGDEAIDRGRAVYEAQFADPPSAAAVAAVANKPACSKPASVAAAGTVHQFMITLDHIKPVIWRRIQLPSDATFWDMHCAVNDAMGWEDAHLHAFRIGSRHNPTEIGIPMEDFAFGEGPSTQAGWDVPIARHFVAKGATCMYEYDFGDGWTHQVKLESIEPRESKAKYPRCIAGARACPPDDCGGTQGYLRIIAVLAGKASDEDDEDADALLEWLGDNFDPEAFDPAKVKFRSATTRLKAVRARR